MINPITQSFVNNPTYLPPEVQANPRFQERLGGVRVDALFAAYLCSGAADCVVGQVFPVCGTWVGP